LDKTNKNSKSVGYIVWVIIIWFIWKQKNNIIFKNSV